MTDIVMTQEKLEQIIQDAVKLALQNTPSPQIKLVHHGIQDLQKCPQCSPELEKLVQDKIENYEMNSRDSEIDREVKKMFPTHRESASLFGEPEHEPTRRRREPTTLF